MNDNITITFDDRKIKQVLEKALKKSNDLNIIYKKMGDQLMKSTDKTFKHEGRIGSIGIEQEPWKPLAESTKKWRKRIGKENSPILQLTGNLKNSPVYEYDKNMLKWGPSTVAPYAKYHISPLPRKKIPLRQFIGFFHEDFQRLCQVTRDFIMKIGE
jgi:phage gpG-like protein